MALPKTQPGYKMLIQLSDGASPPTFGPLCGINARSFTREGSVNEFNLRDCSNPDAPGWTKRVMAALSANIEGSGVLDQDTVDEYEGFLTTSAGNVSRPVRVVLDYPFGGKRTYQGNYLLQSLAYTGNDEDLIQVSMTLVSDGEVEALPVGSP